MSCAAAALLAAGATPARAQDSTNEAWIGQTGETNTISIDQTGIGNSAGADATERLINQDGRFNTITIEQFGWRNATGAEDRDENPLGVNQVGDRNTLDVNQSNGDVAGSNAVGAIWQESGDDVAQSANRLLVHQSSSGRPEGDVAGDGAAGHVISAITQINTGFDQGENLIDILQRGGLDGVGNTVERALQEGFGNLVDIEQSENRNGIGLARQEGSGNELAAVQERGAGNIIDSSDQIGEANKARITQSGDENYVSSVYQNNEGVGISGNTIAVTLAGDDNGGDGLGGLGFFASSVAELPGVFQGEFAQFGDDNDISFTVNGGNENLFGIRQEGTGHGAVVAIGRTTGDGAIVASGNEVAVLQFGGDDNDMSLDVIGNRNVAGVTMDGSRNRLELDQSGDDNVIDAIVEGGNNNGPLAGGIDAAIADLGLTAGQGLQAGSLNTSLVRVAGDANLFAFSQEGDGNRAEISVAGSANQSGVIQANDSNSALVRQAGSGNSMAVHQF